MYFYCCRTANCWAQWKIAKMKMLYSHVNSSDQKRKFKARSLISAKANESWWGAPQGGGATVPQHPTRRGWVGGPPAACRPSPRLWGSAHGLLTARATSGPWAGGRGPWAMSRGSLLACWRDAGIRNGQWVPMETKQSQTVPSQCEQGLS